MGERTDMTRSAAVAGYFYSREADALRGEITALMREGAALRERQAPGLAGLFGQGTTLPGGARHPLMVLLPHAGYMYSGAVACAALAGVELPRRLIVLGPSHTGVGHMQGFWPEGAWRTPLGDIPVDAELGKELESLGGGFAPDAGHIAAEPDSGTPNPSDAHKCQSPPKPRTGPLQAPFKHTRQTRRTRRGRRGPDAARSGLIRATWTAAPHAHQATWTA